MLEADLPEFTLLLDSVCALMTRGSYTPNETSSMIFFHALAEFDMASVRAGFQQHVKTSRFSPTPADIRDAIEATAGGDGRLGAEEAWALALTARDEADTVVWTGEVAEAWNVARVVYGQGDEVGARMAFKEAYARNVAAARAARLPVQWHIAEGHDAARRVEAVKVAKDRGRIASNTADILALPAPREVLQLPAPDAPDDVKAAAFARFDAVRAAMTGPRDYTPSPADLDRQDMERRRALAADQVQAYTEAATA